MPERLKDVAGSPPAFPGNRFPAAALIFWEAEVHAITELEKRVECSPGNKGSKTLFIKDEDGGESPPTLYNWGYGPTGRHVNGIHKTGVRFPVAPPELVSRVAELVYAGG